MPGPRRSLLSRALGSSGVGRQFAQAVRRVVDTLLPPAPRSSIPARPAVLPPVSPASDIEVRFRARQALAEARAHLEPLLGEGPRPAEEAVEHPLTESVLLRQSLRAYTDHVERLLAAAEEERRALRAQINRLTEEVLVLRAELTEIRAALPAAASASSPAAEPSAAAPATPREAAPGALPVDGAETGKEEAHPSEGDEHPLDGRIFPAGSVGIVVELRPRQQPRHVEALCARLLTNPLVERAEPVTTSEEATRLRLAFRHPVAWEQLQEAVAQAAGAQVDAAGACLRDRVLHLRLRAVAGGASHPVPPDRDPPNTGRLGTGAMAVEPQAGQATSCV